MKQLIILALLSFSLISCAQQETASLYDRLGGEEGISSIIEDAVAMHSENPIVAARFAPYSDQPERLAQIKKHFVAFVSAGTGGPHEYKGRDMVTAHTGMNISAEEFVAVVDDLMVVLNQHNMDDQTKKDMLYISWSLKNMIVGK